MTNETNKATRTAHQTLRQRIEDRRKERLALRAKAAWDTEYTEAV